MQRYIFSLSSIRRIFYTISPPLVNIYYTLAVKTPSQDISQPIYVYVDMSPASFILDFNKRLYQLIEDSYIGGIIEGKHIKDFDCLKDCKDVIVVSVNYYKKNKAWIDRWISGEWYKTVITENMWGKN
jgi:hypothetical protein